MKFADRFPFPLHNLVVWVVIIAAWCVWEVWGASHAKAATFTYLLRTTTDAFRYGRLCLLIAWLVLGWHFIWHKAAWWLSFVGWLRGN